MTIIVAGHVLMWCGQLRPDACAALAKAIGFEDSAPTIQRAAGRQALAKLRRWGHAAGGELIALDPDGAPVLEWRTLTPAELAEPADGETITIDIGGDDDAIGLVLGTRDRKMPNPDNMHGAGDGFPGSDYD